MTLSFQTKWPERMGELAGKPNYFPEKIIAGLPLPDYRKMTLNDLLSEITNPTDEEFMSGSTNPNFNHIPKLHTIRSDPHNRWKAGMDIHMVINNRTKDRFQFAPMVKCVSVQEVVIRYSNGYREIYIDDDCFYADKYNGTQTVWNGYGNNNIEQLTLNDGFPSVESFFAYFNENFKGKIIGWTDLKY